MCRSRASLDFAACSNMQHEKSLAFACPTTYPNDRRPRDSKPSSEWTRPCPLHFQVVSSQRLTRALAALLSVNCIDIALSLARIPNLDLHKWNASAVSVTQRQTRVYASVHHHDGAQSTGFPRNADRSGNLVFRFCCCKCFGGYQPASVQWCTILSICRPESRPECPPWKWFLPRPPRARNHHFVPSSEVPNLSITWLYAIVGLAGAKGIRLAQRGVPGHRSPPLGISGLAPHS